MDSCIHGALNCSRGDAVDSSPFLPRFARAVESSESLFGAVDFAAHSDNSAARIYAVDFNPRDSRGDLSEKPCRYATPWAERRGGGNGGCGGGASQRPPARCGEKRSGYFPQDGFRVARTGNIFKIHGKRLRGREGPPMFLSPIRSRSAELLLKNIV